MLYDQVPFDAAEFIENPEPRCACLLLLDTSGSMGGEAIRQLNAGLQAFADDVRSDTLASKRVEVAVVSFGPVETVTDFGSAADFVAPTLTASGGTPMGEAISRGLDLLERRKSIYREQGITYYRPWIFLITDGSPTDEWKSAAARVHAGEESNSFSFFSVGVEGADMDTLARIGVRTPLKLRGLEFAGLFSWLSNSMSSVSRSQTSDAVPLENPTAPDGWAIV